MKQIEEQNKHIGLYYSHQNYFDKNSDEDEDQESPDKQDSEEK